MERLTGCNSKVVLRAFEKQKNKMNKEQNSDKNVDHPSHYTFSKIEVIDVIEAWDLGYRLSNVVKYIARAPYKGKYLEDLKKARWYLDREIQKTQEVEEE
jgi:hypothetical protein